MNPRVVLLLSIAGLFIAMWSMDSQHQTAVMLSRKAQRQATMAQSRPVVSADVALLSLEGRHDESCFNNLTYAELESSQETSEMGWDCLPTESETDSIQDSNDVVEVEAETLLISNLTLVDENAETTEPVVDDSSSDNSDYECSKTNWSRDQIPMDNLWIFGGIDIPLPDGIAAGEYRIVSDRGEVRSLTLLPAELAYHGGTTQVSARELYDINVDGTRWYFIRIKQASAPADTAKTEFDADATAASIRNWFNTDMRLTLWQWSSRWDRLQRQVSAIGRQSQTWSNTMTQAIWHAVKAVESAKRISAEQAPSDIRL